MQQETPSRVHSKHCREVGGVNSHKCKVIRLVKSSRAGRQWRRKARGGRDWAQDACSPDMIVRRPTTFPATPISNSRPRVRLKHRRSLDEFGAVLSKSTAATYDELVCPHACPLLGPFRNPKLKNHPVSFDLVRVGAWGEVRTFDKLLSTRRRRSYPAWSR